VLRRRIREIQATPERVAFPVGRVFCAGLLVATAVYALEALLVTQGRLDSFFDTRVYNGLLVASSLVCLARGLFVRSERLPWLLLGTALALWTTGDLYYYFFLSGAPTVPIPSIADSFYLAFYPVSYVALALLLRKRMRGFGGYVWLDGVIASLAVAAVGAAVVFDEVLKTTGGSALVIATNLAYPLADVLLLSLVVAMFGLTGWRFDGTWALVALGFGVFAIADSVYLYETASGTYLEGGPLDVGWPAALVLIACSAWQPVRKLEGVRDESWAVLTVPTVFGAVGLTVLVYDHFVRINTIALALATATLATVIVRAVLTFRERVSLLAASREEALTDALTGLGNRRRFVLDLEQKLGEPEPTALVVFDLDGFKSYNDAFGHTAGDTLLSRVAGRLAAATAGFGTAYRLGGDEFCVLASIGFVGPGSVIERAAEALTEEGEGFAVRCSYGAVLMPAEATGLTEALRIADDRMYLQKQQSRPSAERQSVDVLLSVLNERDSLLAHHLADVADLAEAVSRRLDVATPQLATIRQAAELHDVGKLAIPEEILTKPTPLTKDEWEFIKRHTLIGERILASAPALKAAGEMVRSSHERWDGAGYPDALRGGEIPLGARIIAVCDAFDAMTSSRPYASMLSRQEAIRELVRCSGTQFDPKVVDAFADVQADLIAELVA
jgi:diguanylate cyclase (GGDEF)-like protein